MILLCFGTRSEWLKNLEVDYKIAIGYRVIEIHDHQKYPHITTVKITDK